MSTELNQELSSLAEKIEEVDSNAAQRLRDMKNFIQDSRRGSGELAHLDFYSILNPSGIEERAVVVYQKRGLGLVLATLEWFRNFLILLPIALTWLGLSHATQSYDEVVTKKQQAGEAITEPFLLLWERGFPTLNSDQGFFFDWLVPDTFSGLATVDFAILFVVLGLTIVIHLWEDVYGQKAARRAASLRLDVENALWKLSQLSAKQRRTQATQTTDKLTKAVESFRQSAEKQLNQATETTNQFTRAVESFGADTKELLSNLKAEQRRVEQLAKRRQREFGDLKLFSNSLKMSTTQLIGYVQRTDTVYRDLNSSVGQLTQQVEKVEKQQQKLHRSLDSFSTNSVKMMQEVETGISALSSAIAGNRNNAQIAANAMREMGDLASKLVAGETSLREALAQTGDDNKKIWLNLQTTSLQLAEVASKTNQAINLLYKSTQSVDTGLLELKEIVADNARMVETVINKVENLASNLVAGEETLQKALDQTSRQNKILVDDMQKTSNQLVEVASKTDQAITLLSRQTTRLDESTQKVETGVVDLKKVVADNARMVESAINTVGGLASNLAAGQRSLQEALDRTSRENKILVDNMQATSNKLVQVASKTDQAITLLSQQTTRLDESTQKVETGVVGLKKVVADNTGMVQTVIDKMGDLAKNLAAGQTSLQKALDQTSRQNQSLVGDMQKTSNKLVQVASKTDQAITLLSQQTTHLGKSTQKVETGVVDLKEVVAGNTRMVESVTNKMASREKALQEALARTSRQNQTMGADLQTTISTLSEVATVLNQVSGELAALNRSNRMSETVSLPPRSAGDTGNGKQ